jgi:LysR family transcriptional regulator, regulator for genes of the gallate degradation pathway
MIEVTSGVRKLWLFDAVCQTGGIGQAALSRGLSQPAVSLAMNKLEKNFGVTLLVRGQRGVDLTHQGTLLYRRVTRMISQIDQALVMLLGVRIPSPVVGTIRRQLTDVQIRCHLAIAQKGSAAAASRDLDVSQPAVHRAARELEQVVRTTLYRRRVHGVSVNAAGMEFARRLRLAMNEIAQAGEEITLSQGEKAGLVEVGVLPLVPQRLMALAIKNLLIVHPEAAVKLHEASHEELLAQLRFGKIDLIIGALRTPRLQGDVIETDLFSDPHAVVVRRGHKLTELVEITKTDLAKYDWIIPHEGMPRRIIIENMLSSLPQRPRLVVETSSLSMILAMLAESDCITLLPRSQIQQGERSIYLYTLSVDIPEGNRVVGLTIRADWLATPVQSSFIAQLQKSCDYFLAPFGYANP